MSLYVKSFHGYTAAFVSAKSTRQSILINRWKCEGGQLHTTDGLTLYLDLQIDFTQM
jgi:hypothetical protein